MENQLEKEKEEEEEEKGWNKMEIKGKTEKDIPWDKIRKRKETLETLDLSGNGLKELPHFFGELKRLKRLFLSNNQFESFPSILNQCSSLEMIAFRGNEMKQIPMQSLPFSSLKWLILTGNQLNSLPEDIGQCILLQKLMLAGNQLKNLPSSIVKCVNLQLIRISVNQMDEFPSQLFQLPKLSWLAYSGNPFCNSTQFSSPSLQNRDSLPFIPSTDIDVKEKLGEGASGIIYSANLRSKQDQKIALKIFKGALTSDGLPYSEMVASICAGKHPNLIPLIGKLSEEEEGKEGIIMEWIDPSFKNLAGPPSFESCTRDVYSLETTFSPEVLFKIVFGMGKAFGHLHSQGIIHGDFYGHNILFKHNGDSILGDFGAASLFNPSEEPLFRKLEKIEVRSFGCLLEELLNHCPTLGPDSVHSIYFPLFSLRDQCLQSDPMLRPSFSEVESVLFKIHSNKSQV